MVARAADRALPRPPAPRRLRGHQRVQRRPRGARLRGAARPVPRPGRLRALRPLRPRRAGDPDRAGAVRAAADHHQRLRRRTRGRPRRRRGLARHGHERPPGVPVHRAAAGDAAGHERRPARAGAGLGDGDHRGAGRRARASAGSSPAGSPTSARTRWWPARSWSPSARCCSRGSPCSSERYLDPMRRARTVTVRGTAARADRDRFGTRLSARRWRVLRERVPRWVPIGHARGSLAGHRRWYPHADLRTLSLDPGRRAAPRQRRAAVTTSTSRTTGSGGDGGDKGAVAVGGQDFTEMQVMAAIYQQLLEDEGYDVETKLVTTRDVYLGELEQRQRRHRPGLPRRHHRLPQHRGERPRRRRWCRATTPTRRWPRSSRSPRPRASRSSPPSEATDQNAFFVTQEFADENDLETLSDFAALGQPIKLGAPEDCAGRADCEGGLTEVYGIDITEIVPLDFGSAQVKDAVVNGEVQLGETGTTDGTPRRARPGRCSRTTRASSRRRTSPRRSTRTSWPRTPSSRTCSTSSRRR